MFMCSIILCLCSSILAKNKENTELLMIHAIFRHGERTPVFSYPKDPYMNHTYYPFGRGSLTNHGKMQEYKLGQFLRNRYDTFLGDYYTQKVMEVRSTGYERTRKSALLVLAGLWPPRGEQIWNDALPWQPIPVDYKDPIDDDLLTMRYLIYKCPKRKRLLQSQINMQEVQKIFIEPYKDLINYLEQNTGMRDLNPQKLSELYMTLKTQVGMNLTLPKWTRQIYPEKLKKAASQTFNYLNYLPEVRALNSGYLLQKIVNDSKSKIDGKYGNDTKKIVLYSAHESTLGLLTNVLQMAPHIPNYASSIIFELHRIKQDNTYAMRIFYKRNAAEDNLEEINLGCSILRFDMFLKSIRNILPTIPYNLACV